VHAATLSVSHRTHSLAPLLCRSLALLFFFLVGGQPQDTHRDWMKFAGAWGWWTAAIAFYDGIAALTKEVYGKVSLGAAGTGICILCAGRI
jgi:succinate-acetate transporter protein